MGKAALACSRRGFVTRALGTAVAGVTAGLVLSASGARAEESAGFVGGFEDLPLMAGLEEVAEARIVFDKPDGRIVEAFAVGAVEAEAVRRFYAVALPQLGWRPLDKTSFQREGEILRIEIGERNGRTEVRFAVSPR